MPDQYTEVTKVGYGNRIMGSFGGIFMGILLFLASFFMLYWNEGRVDVGNIAQKAVEINATEQAGEWEGQLVAASETTGRQPVFEQWRLFGNT